MALVIFDGITAARLVRATCENFGDRRTQFRRARGTFQDLSQEIEDHCQYQPTGIRLKASDATRNLEQISQSDMLKWHISKVAFAALEGQI